MPLNYQDQFLANAKLFPLYDADHAARQRPVNLAESTTYLKGQVLALISSRNEIQTATGSTNITGGTFTITIDGRTTVPLAYNAAAATVQAALEALANVLVGGIGVSGGAINTATPFTFTWQNQLANRNVNQLVVNTALLTGTSTVVTVATVQAGRSNAVYGPYSSATIPAPTVAPVPTAAAGVAFPAGVYTLGYTYITPSGGESLLNTAPATVTTSAGNLAIAVASLTPLPTGVSGVNYYVSSVAGNPSDLVLAGTSAGGATTLNTVPAAGAKKAPLTSTAYANTAGTGVSTAKGLLLAACTTDADGNITGQYEWGITTKYTDMYVTGTFDTKDIVGLDAKAIADMAAILESGTIADGVLRIA